MDKKETKMGRPSKFDKNKDKILMMARHGLTEKRIADILEIDKSTLTKWKQKHPDFFTSLKNKRFLSDLGIEASYYELAKGYEHEAVHFSNHMGVVSATPYIKKYAPSESAGRFWLKNRQPEMWRDKTEVDNNISGALSVNVDTRVINSRSEIKKTTESEIIENKTVETIVETVINKSGVDYDTDEVF